MDRERERAHRERAHREPDCSICGGGGSSVESQLLQRARDAENRCDELSTKFHKMETDKESMERKLSAGDFELKAQEARLTDVTAHLREAQGELAFKAFGAAHS